MEEKKNVNNNGSSKKIQISQQNKKIILLVVVIIAVFLMFKVVLKSLNKDVVYKSKKADIASIIKNKETKVVYVGSSDSKKCKKCNDIINYLNNEKIDYVIYDVEDYSKKEYKAMLNSIEINPDDFGYPAVIYIREGKLYSNVINVNDTKSVETFIKDYELKKNK